MTKTLTKLAAISLMTVVAHAITITAPSPITANNGTPPYVASGDQNNVPDILDVLNPTYGPLTELYKNDNPGDSGSFASNYDTSYSNGDGDFSITYTGGSSIAPGQIYLLVKDGNREVAWYFYSLNWNGTETISGTGFWPQQGSISHVSLYRGRSVPDGGATVALLGIGLLGLGAMRRKLS